MAWAKVLTLAICAALLVGCGGTGAESVKPPDLTPKEKIKEVLEGLIETGQGGSEIGVIMQEVEPLKETDPALASELEEAARTMMSSGMSGSQLKNKAQELLDKLEGSSGGG